MDLVPFEPWHLGSIQLDTWSKDSMIGQDRKALAERLDGKAITALGDDDVLAIAGVNLLASGTGYAYILLSPKMRDRPMVLHRMVLRGLGMIMREYNLERLDAEVERAFKLGQRWAERLGFHETAREGRMVRYTRWRQQ